MKRIASVVLCLALMITSFSQMAIISLAAGEPTITCTSKECYPGDTVSVEVNLANNPGIMYLEITPTYSSELGAPSVQNGSIITDLTREKQYIWVADNDVDTDGKLVTLTFSMPESITPGDYSVGFIFRSAYNYDEELVTFKTVPATIRVKAKPVPVTGLSLSKRTATVETGDETLTLTPIFAPENATNKNLTWVSDNESVATVRDGIVTLIKKGIATINATTEDGKYTASCVVTINCSHRMGHDIPAEESTCIKQGHIAYIVCDECGEIINGSDAKLPFADHTYVEKVDTQYLKTAATCNSKAVYHKSCSVCGVQSEVSFFEYGGFDGNNHIGGTYKSGQKEATCYEEGYTGDTYCANCGVKVANGSVIAAGHKLNKVEAKEATHYADGNVEYYVCSVCGKLFKDANATLEITKKDTVIVKGEHDYGNAYRTDEKNHWKECACGNKIQVEVHTYDNTCDTTCNVCGATRTITHIFGEYVYNNDATLEKDGTSTRKCSVCGHSETVVASGTKLVPTNPFIDVKAGAYYEKGVLWAVAKGVTKGTSATTFSPNKPCSRGEIVTFLWRANGCPEPQTTSNPFTDVKAGAYYSKAVLWAVEKGVTAGTAPDKFSPNADCTREQIVTFLWRSQGKPVMGSANPFKDVKGGTYYYNAVLWAVNEQITNGTSPTTFAPKADCTRGQIVTFLYRCLA